jgi:transposase
MQILGSSFQKAARVMERRGYLTRDAQNRYAFRIEFLGRWLRDWEEYEEESEHLEDIRQRLKRLADPWHNVEETVVTDEDKRRFGLRP